jgi:hypothetical protein
MLDNFPFLTIIGYADNEYIGIIQNIDNQIASLYAYDKIHDEGDRKLFLSLGEEWWWETNRKLPINISLLNRWPFAYTCQSFSVKQMTVISGPEVKLNDQITKRIKRRSINLLKNNP